MKKYICLITLYVFALLALPAYANTDDKIRQLGVGVWCYELKKKMGTATQMADKAVAYGINSVRLKVHDGTRIFRYEPAAPAVAKAMHVKGIVVLAWGYTYATRPEREAKIIERYLDSPDYDGYVFDTEIHVERKHSWTKLETLMNLVRTHRDNCPKCKNKLLGFAPFALPSKHPHLNYPAMVKGCDFIEPQVYSATMRNKPSTAILRMYNDWVEWQDDNGLSKPIVPLGQGYDPRLDHVKYPFKAADILTFGKGTRGWEAVSFWSWQELDKSKDRWEAVRQIAEGRNGGWVSVGNTPHPQRPETAERSIWSALIAWLIVFPISAYILVCAVIMFFSDWNATGYDPLKETIRAARWPITLYRWIRRFL